MRPESVAAKWIAVAPGVFQEYKAGTSIMHQARAGFATLWSGRCAALYEFFRFQRERLHTTPFGMVSKNWCPPPDDP